MILGLSPFCLVHFTKNKKLSNLKLKSNLTFDLNYKLNHHFTVEVSYFSLKIYEITYSYMSLEWSNSWLFKNYEFLKI